MPKLNLRMVIGAIAICFLIFYIVEVYTVSRSKTSEGKLEQLRGKDE